MGGEEAGELITSAMRERHGVWLDDAVSPPIGLSDIRRWALAVYWPNTPPRLFWDAKYARETRWGGIVAPEDFNPFAWPVLQAPRRAAISVSDTGLAVDRFGLPMPHRGAILTPPGSLPIGGMNAGRRDEFGTRMRPGDAIASRARLADWEMSSTRFGPTLFVAIEIEWRNQHDRIVRLRRQSNMRYFVEKPGVQS